MRRRLLPSTPYLRWYLHRSVSVLSNSEFRKRSVSCHFLHRPQSRGCLSDACCPILCGAAALDIIFGSLATLIGALGSWMLRKNKWAVCLPPILANTIVIPWVLRFAYGSEDMILYAMVTVGIGEILAIGVLGNLLMGVLYKYRQIMFGKKNLA